jgi:hypothetical protein
MNIRTNAQAYGGIVIKFALVGDVKPRSCTILGRKPLMEDRRAAVGT